MFLHEYEKLRLIGKGSFASVYKVRHAKYGYIRALKVCNDFIENEYDKAWHTFISECKVLLSIGNGSHPNIVHIYQPRLLDNRAMVEMDCVEGDSVHDYIAEKGFIGIDEFFDFALQSVDAVAYCHVDVYKFLMSAQADNLQPDPHDGRKYVISAEKEGELIRKYGIVHNDLHSNNIIRREYDGKYILLDFGLSIQNSHCVKSSSRFDGAIEYSSPEKLERGEVSAASDVYALGILMYEMLCGHVPFPFVNADGTSPESARSRVYMQHLHEMPPAILQERRKTFETEYPGSDYVRDYPTELERIIMKCLAKRPEERYVNAKELLADLKECHNKFVTESVRNAAHDTSLMAVVAENKRLQQQVSELQARISELEAESSKYEDAGGQEDNGIQEDDDIPIVDVEEDTYEEDVMIPPPPEVPDNPAGDKHRKGWKSIFKK